jgi:16S rRNA (uracil1498-N3)-methyltransferase
VSEAFVFVDDLDAPVLTLDDRHHLDRVLRIRAGAPITIADGRGRSRPARFGPALVVDGEIFEEPAAAVELTVGCALAKGDKTEWAVQKLTELGIDTIIPFTADRCIVRWEPGRVAHHTNRLRKVAREAAMQCRRPRLPTVADLARFDDLVTRPAVALADRGGAPISAGDTTILVGPEGGWSPRERNAASKFVGLGAYVLRAETAAVAAGVLLASGPNRSS